MVYPFSKAIELNTKQQTPGCSESCKPYLIQRTPFMFTTVLATPPNPVSSVHEKRILFVDNYAVMSTYHPCMYLVS